MRKTPVVPNWIIFLSISFVFLSLYVFLSSQIIAVGYKMEKAKKKHEDLTIINKNYKAEVFKSTSLSELLKRAENFNLELVSPSKWCYLDISPEKTEGKKNGTAEAGTN